MFHPNGPSFMELARQAMSSTRSGYDLLAPKFDYTPFRTPDFVLEKVAEYLSETDVSDGSSENSLRDAVDLCCGTGAGVQMLAPICTGKITGVDFSQGMLERAETNLLESEQTYAADIEWLQHDVLDLPFKDQFDLVVSFGAQGHFLPREQELLLDQVSKILKPGGRFVFVTTEMPGFFSLTHLLSRGFNFAMRMRNLFFRPPFIMYYLTFLLPQIRQQLEARGFSVKEVPAYEGRLAPLRIVDARLK